MASLVISLQSPKNNKPLYYLNGEYNLSWVELPLFNSEEKIIETNNNLIILKNVEANKIFDLFLLDKKKYTFNKTNSFQNISISIAKKDTAKTEPISDVEICKLLIESKIIKIKS